MDTSFLWSEWLDVEPAVSWTKLFEKAMRDLEWKMLVCGHNDYPKFCDEHIKLYNKDKITKHSLFLFIKKLYIIYRAEKANMES